MKYRQKHIKFCFLHPSASKCSASGPGLEEHGVIVKKPADFTCFMSGSSKGKLNVQVFGPGRKQIDCLVQDNQDNTYSCQYEPIKEGECSQCAPGFMNNKYTGLMRCGVMWCECNSHQQWRHEGLESWGCKLSSGPLDRQKWQKLIEIRQKRQSRKNPTNFWKMGKYPTKFYFVD